MIIPFLQDETVNQEQRVIVSKEYAIDYETGQLTGNIVEDKEAVKVWIIKALKTSRYIHDIYTWDYGQDLNDLIGKGYEKGFINSEVERIITDTLLINPNIRRCYDFDITFNDDLLTVNFTVETVFGEVEISV